MKKILMIVLVLVLVIGGVIGGVMIGKGMGGKEAAAATEEPSVGDEIVADATGHGEAEAQDASSGHGEAKEAKPSGGHGEPAGGHDELSRRDLIVSLDQITTNLEDPRGRTYVQTTIELEAYDAKAREVIENNIPPFRDAVIMSISSKTQDDLQTHAGKERFKRELLVRLESICNQPRVIRNIFMSDFTVVRQ